MKKASLEDYIKLGQDMKRTRKKEMDCIDNLSRLFGKDSKIVSRAKTILKKTDELRCLLDDELFEDYHDNGAEANIFYGPIDE